MRSVPFDGDSFLLESAVRKFVTLMLLYDAEEANALYKLSLEWIVPSMLTTANRDRDHFVGLFFYSYHLTIRRLV